MAAKHIFEYPSHICFHSEDLLSLQNYNILLLLQPSIQYIQWGWHNVQSIILLNSKNPQIQIFQNITFAFSKYPFLRTGVYFVLQTPLLMSIREFTKSLSQTSMAKALASTIKSTMDSSRQPMQCHIQWKLIPCINSDQKSIIEDIK